MVLRAERNPCYRSPKFFSSSTLHVCVLSGSVEDSGTGDRRNSTRKTVVAVIMPNSGIRTCQIGTLYTKDPRHEKHLRPHTVVGRSLSAHGTGHGHDR